MRLTRLAYWIDWLRSLIAAAVDEDPTAPAPEQVDIETLLRQGMVLALVRAAALRRKEEARLCKGRKPEICKWGLVGVYLKKHYNISFQEFARVAHIAESTPSQALRTYEKPVPNQKRHGPAHLEEDAKNAFENLCCYLGVTVPEDGHKAN